MEQQKKKKEREAFIGCRRVFQRRSIIFFLFPCVPRVRPDSARVSGPSYKAQRYPVLSEKQRQQQRDDREKKKVMGSSRTGIRGDWKSHAGNEIYASTLSTFDFTGGVDPPTTDFRHKVFFYANPDAGRWPSIGTGRNF